MSIRFFCFFLLACFHFSLISMLSVNLVKVGESPMLEDSSYAAVIRAIQDGDDQAITPLLDTIDPHQTVAIRTHDGKEIEDSFLGICFKISLDQPHYKIIRMLAQKSVAVSLDSHFCALMHVYTAFFALKDVYYVSLRKQVKRKNTRQRFVEYFYYLLKAFPDKNIDTLQQAGCRVLAKMIIDMLFEYHSIVVLNLAIVKTKQYNNELLRYHKDCKILDKCYSILKRLFVVAQNQGYSLFPDQACSLLTVALHYKNSALSSILLKNCVYTDDDLESAIEKAKLAVVKVDSCLLKTDPVGCPYSFPDRVLHTSFRMDYDSLKDIVAMLRRFLIIKRVIATASSSLVIGEKIAHYDVEYQKDMLIN